jgi:putative chitinase
MLSLDQFRAASGLDDKHSARWYGPIGDALDEFGIDNLPRIAAFIAQTGHESLGFRLTRELWGPTPTQRLYELPATKARALGNIEHGDGRRFLGRGLIQITGRANYASCGAALKLDLLVHPELLEKDEAAARSAAWWWSHHGCNALADAGNFIGLTRRINGGTNGLVDRQRRWHVATTALRL